jgi:hypothetical protein
VALVVLELMERLLHHRATSVAPVVMAVVQAMGELAAAAVKARRYLVEWEPTVTAVRAV